MVKLLHKYLDSVVYSSPDGGSGGDVKGGPKSDESVDDKGLEGDDQNDHKSKIGSGLFEKSEDENSDDDDGEDDDDGKQQDEDSKARPDDVPEKFWDNDKGEVKTSSLLKAFNDTKKALDTLKRDKGAKIGAPESAEDYFKEGLELDEDSPFSIDGPDDPGLKAWAEVGKKYDLPKDVVVGIAKDWLKEMSPHAAEPIDPSAEKEKLGKNAQNIIDGVFTWLEGQEKNFDDGDIEVIDQLSQTANGVKFLAKMRNQSGEQPIPVSSVGSTTMSANEWHSKYNQAIKDNNYAEQERLDALSAKLWPDGIPRSDVPDSISNQERMNKKG